MRIIAIVISLALAGCATTSRYDDDATANAAYEINVWAQRQNQRNRAPLVTPPRQTTCETVRLGYTYQTRCRSN